MASRRKARELALQMLFQWEVGAHPPAHVLATFLSGRDLDPNIESFTRELFEGAAAEAESLDKQIQENSPNWKMDRMAAVDRNILRMALYELEHFPETPPAVVINEALEIARRFSSEDSVEFVNGVLDAIRKKMPLNGSPPETRPAGAKTSPRKRSASRSKGGYEK